MNKQKAMILMALVMMSRGTSFIFSKNLMDGFAPMNILAVRFITAFLILTLVFFNKMRHINKALIIKGALLGGAYTACMVAEMYGLRLIETATSSFIENSAVVIVPFYEMILTKKLPKKSVVFIALMAFAGVGFLTVAGGASVNIGIILAIIAALIYGVCVMLTEYVTRDGSDPITIGVLQMGFMGLFSLMLTFITDKPRLPQGGVEWAMIMMLVLVCSCFGFTFQPLAQKYISVEMAGVFTTLNPLSTCVIGVLFAGEGMGIFKIIGGALIITSVLLSVKDANS